MRIKAIGAECSAGSDGHVVLAKESRQAVLEGRAQRLANDRPVD